MSEIVHTGTLIVGGGPAGLAVGACLRRLDLPSMILEQGDRVGAKWSQHYDRLHFNTDSRPDAAATRAGTTKRNLVPNFGIMGNDIVHEGLHPAAQISQAVQQGRPARRQAGTFSAAHSFAACFTSPALVTVPLDRTETRVTLPGCDPFQLLIRSPEARLTFPPSPSIA